MFYTENILKIFPFKIAFFCVINTLFAVIALYLISFVNEDGYRLLEISPEKQCSLGEYTWGPKDSARYKYCSQQKVRNTTQQMTCNKGFVGAPVHFEYSPESNSNWENTRCQNIGKDTDPCPL